ncbi:MAG: class I SAM-dependent methyltransferase [Parachlamydiales bacterium]|nr:class I SAM-dependent methyltransferase [Parachlamydiales bacterium]
MSTGDAPVLSLFFKVRFYLLKEQLKTIFFYYRKLYFLLCDLSLSIVYLFFNPYRISKRYLKKKRAFNIYAYGETPLTTLEKIFQAFEITKQDCFYELGCGRGKGSFWAATFWKCHVIAIEQIFIFYNIARSIQRLFHIKNIEFHHGDFLEADYSKANVIYLYGTIMQEEEIHRFIRNASFLSSDTKIITISFPLSDYSNDFYVKKEISVAFPWGTTSAYLNGLSR